MEQTPETVWNSCLDIIRDNIKRQAYKTWFEPITAVSLEEEDGLYKLTVQLPSRFYYEWLEEHYFGLLRKTVTKVLGDQGRLFYDIVIERDNAERGRKGTSMHLPARPQAAQPPAGDRPARPPEAASQSPSEPEAETEPPAEVDAQSASPQSASPRSASPQPTEPSSAPPSEPARPEGPPPSTGRRPPGSQPPRRQHAATGSTVPAGTTSAAEPPVQNPFAIPGIQRAQIDPRLNNSYTFERFIEGDCNQLARSASWAIAQRPGSTSFNPFLIYGGVGLGKTHLIQAIGNYAQRTEKASTVLYVSSDRFTSEFVQAIQNNRIGQFSAFYRQIDLLIVDDVQFFSGKEKTQEEFFHIFNSLHQSGKQIVLSADRAPNEIDGIEERLLSRFQWGLTADVQPPELETRIAILQRKAEDEGIELPRQVVEFIAHNIKSNIRELEGALVKLAAHAAFQDEDINLDMAKEVLRDLVKDRRVNLTIDEIQRIVCEAMHINEDQIRARTRKREVVRARQIAMFFCKEMTQHSLKTIGLHFGGRDHSTVIHANKTVEDHMETDPQFQETVADIRRIIELRSR